MRNYQSPKNLQHQVYFSLSFPPNSLLLHIFMLFSAFHWLLDLTKAAENKESWSVWMKRYPSNDLLWDTQTTARSSGKVLLGWILISVCHNLCIWERRISMWDLEARSSCFHLSIIISKSPLEQRCESSRRDRAFLLHGMFHCVFCQIRVSQLTNSDADEQRGIVEGDAEWFIGGRTKQMASFTHPLLKELMSGEISFFLMLWHES